MHRLLLVCFVAVVSAQLATGNERPAPGEWRQMVRRLAGEDARIRIDAAAELAEAPQAEALEEIIAIARGDSLEASARAVRILEAWLVHAPVPLALKVDEALTQLKEEATPPLSTQCAAILEGHRRLRRDRAVQRLEELGAKIDWGPDYATLLEDYCVRNAEPAVEYYLGDLAVDLRMHSRPGLMGANLPEEAPGPDLRHTLPKIPRTVFLTAKWTGSDEDVRLLRHLGGGWRLHVYVVKGSGVSIADVKLAMAEVPDAVPPEERGPSLGVSSSDAAECRISDVLKGGAAWQAGVRPGDYIVQIGEKPVHTFQDLVRAVGEQEPGADVELRWLRNGEEHSGRAKLVSWDEVDTESGLWSGQDVDQMLNTIQFRRMQMFFPLK